MAIAIQERRPVVWNDLEKPEHLAWQERARQLDYRSVIALPLEAEGKVFGALSLYASEANFFDDDEVRLLSELAANASFGISYIQKDSELQHLAYYDKLTGLPNAALVEDRLGQAIARAKHRGRRIAVLLIDIVGLRQINDVLGLPVGDEIVRELGNRLAMAVRDGDTVGRIGGDNFVVALTDMARAEDVAPVVQTILGRLPKSLSVRGQEIFVAARAGIAVYPADGGDAATLLKNSSLAMNSAPEGPDASFAFYSVDANERAQEHLAIGQELRRAVERAELTLHYQPIVGLRERRLIGLEALLRWTNPSLGSVPPGKFIPVAEDTGLIGPIGDWVIRTACEQARTWQKSTSAQVRVSANVSMRQLRDPGFLGRVNQILDSAGLSPGTLNLGIEVTESALMENVEQTAATLRELKGRGLTISIDDFGTGYSSLSYLRQLPLDTLKIDRAFVRDLDTDSSAVTVARSVILLGHGLGLSVVAEGVETERQLEILANLECDAAQGYLFSRPAPPEALSALVATGLLTG